MMDGDFNFNSGVIGGVRQAASSGEIPEFIIVGIKNTNRSKDIFPEEVTYPDGSKDGGRANQYLDFVRDELIPRVAKTYRTTDYRILYGTSQHRVHRRARSLSNPRPCQRLHRGERDAERAVVPNREGQPGRHVQGRQARPCAGDGGVFPQW